ncbi:MAG: ribosome biogenesis GTPase Der [Planctomycetota bacterium]
MGRKTKRRLVSTAPPEPPIEAATPMDAAAVIDMRADLPDPIGCAVIVGRPNVGKSTLFNRLIGAKVAITNPLAGTTRDYLVQPLEFDGVPFELIDTGGIGVVDDPRVEAHVREQIAVAIDMADVLIFLCDGKEGLTSFDREIAETLRRLDRPLILAVNKMDARTAQSNIHEFHELGIELMLEVAAEHSAGLTELLTAVVGELRRMKERRGPAQKSAPDSALRVAVVGKQNVGKSTFVNAVAGEDRAIVSDLPGTTRDAIDIFIEKDGREVLLIDTAGIQRLKKTQHAVEFFAQVRTERAIGRADTILFLIDCIDGVSQTEKKLAALIARTAKPVVIVVNKWDLAAASKVPFDKYSKYVYDRLGALEDAPIQYISALEGKRVWQTLDLARELYKTWSTILPTSRINTTIEAIKGGLEPPRAKRGTKPRLYYATQLGIRPPTFAVFASHAENIDEDYKKYLSRTFKAEMGLSQVPIRVLYRESHKKK